MDDLLLEKCNTFLDNRRALRRKYFLYSPEGIADIAFIYMSNEREINFEMLEYCEDVIRQSFPFVSFQYRFLTKVYAAMMDVSNIEPDIVVNRVMSFEELFNRTFKDTIGLAVLCFSAAERPQVEYQTIYYKALAIYNQMKDLQRSLTNDLDVVYAGILAMAPSIKEDVVDELVIMDDLLVNEYRLPKDFSRRLSYALAFCDGTATQKVQNAMDFIKSCTSKWNRHVGYIYYVLHAVVANLSIPLDTIQKDYDEVMQYLKKSRQYGLFSKPERSLHACMILLNFYVGNNISIYTLTNAILYTIALIKALAQRKSC